MKIVVTNQVALNGGDSAILSALLRIIDANFGKSAQVAVIDKNGDAVRKYYPDLEVQQQFRMRSFGFAESALRVITRGRGIYRLKRSFENLLVAGGLDRFMDPRARANHRLIGSADVVISAGGTYLVEHYDLTESLLQLSMAAASGRPIVLFTQSLGPFHQPDNVRELKKILPSVVLALLRDEQSRQNLAALGFPEERQLVVADAAFTLADPEGIASARQRRLAERPRVALSVRDWSFPGSPDPAGARERYLDSIRAAVEHLVRRHMAEIVFVSTCQGVPEYWLDDSAVALEVTARLAEDVRPAVTVDRDFHRPEALIKLLAGFDLVVSTRMHMCILSLCGGTPVLPIAYEFKTNELFAGMGFGRWVQDIGAMTPDQMTVLTDAYLSQWNDLQPVLMGAVEEQRQRALLAVPALKKALRAATEGLQPAGRSRGRGPRSAARP
jgi:colanic acid/amylovoran biosynthesis protein